MSITNIIIIANGYIAEADFDFRQGAEFMKQRMYERKQELFNFCSSELEITILDGQMNDIIDLLTKDLENEK